MGPLFDYRIELWAPVRCISGGLTSLCFSWEGAGVGIVVLRISNCVERTKGIGNLYEHGARKKILYYEFVDLQSSFQFSMYLGG